MILDDQAECGGRVGLDRVGTVEWKNCFGTSNSLGPQDLGAVMVLKTGACILSCLCMTDYDVTF